MCVCEYRTIMEAMLRRNVDEKKWGQKMDTYKQHFVGYIHR